MLLVRMETDRDLGGSFLVTRPSFVAIPVAQPSGLFRPTKGRIHTYSNRLFRISAKEPGLRVQSMGRYLEDNVTQGGFAISIQEMRDLI
jgi:hypothetical protein